MPNRRKNTRELLKKVGRKALRVGKTALAPAAALALKEIGPLVSKVVSEALKGVGRTAGLPFMTSGMQAIASPMNSSGLPGVNVSAPSANGKVTYTTSPSIRNGKGGNIRVTHREYVADINVEESGFDLQYQFGVNPGNSALFPWLSQIATRYEMYSFRGLRIIYEPQCGTSSTGTLMLAIDYDSSDTPPESKSQMMSYKNAVRSPLWFAASYVCSSPDLHRLKTNYVLNGAQPQNTDIKTYDIGNLFVAIQSDGATQSAGELYVEYDVELMTPQINLDPPSITIPYDSTSGSLEFSLQGPLPVVFDVNSNDDGANIYIGSAGYYIVGLTQGSGTGDTSISRVQGDQLHQVTVSNGTEALSTLMFQVVDPETPALTFTIDGSLSGNITITPLSLSSVLDASGNPLPPTQNYRARLGRLKPFPTFAPPPLLRKKADFRKRPEKSPISSLSRVSTAQLQDSTPEEA